MPVRDYPGRVPSDRVPLDEMPRSEGCWGTPGRDAGQREKAEALRAAFVQDGPADTLSPGALLAALTEAAFADAARLSDDELIGALEAARRLQNRTHYLEVLAVADLAWRRAAQYEQDAADGVPRNARRAQFPDLELAAQLLIGRRHARHLLDEATELTERLPLTLAGMAAGLIDAARASAIAGATLCLSDVDAARVDQTLAPTAHETRADTVARRAVALAMKLDPEAVQREREDARRTRQRTEARREQSGNASFSVREADTSVVLSVQAAIDELAARLRNGGVEGTLDSLRAAAALDRLLARDPLDRLAPLPPEPEDDSEDEDDADGEDSGVATAAAIARTTTAPHVGGSVGNGADPYPGWPAEDDDYPLPPDLVPSDFGSSDAAATAARPLETPPADAAAVGETGETGRRSAPRGAADEDGRGVPGGGQARFPALVNLIVPAATLLGWGTAPGQAGTWGLTDPQETRDIVRAASDHPRTRWCLTVVNERGEAVAHACASGRHPWQPAPARPPGTPPPPPPNPGGPLRSDGPPGNGGPPGGCAGQQDQAARLREFLAGLGITPSMVEPIARGACDHRHAEPRYAPSRTLKHVVRARSLTCTAPGCGGQSAHADFDHVVPYPDGPSDECNLHTPCRAHHRAKQAPDWRVEQPEPGILRWTLPNGRTRVTRPTSYDW